MRFGTAADVPADGRLDTDLCVVGGGAAGLSIAHALAGRHLNVLMLEAGNDRRDERSEAASFAVEEVGEPRRNPEPSRARRFGGSTTLWFGRIAAPDRIDLETRPWVPFSGWPLDFEELQPWLRAAAVRLAVHDFEYSDIERWDRDPTIDTFGDGPDSTLDVLMWAGNRDLALTCRPALETAPNVRVLLDATVSAIVTDDASTTAEHLVVARPDGATFTVHARTVVLAAGGLENPRLLLSSRCCSERGLGNRNDLVGRFYMDHPRGEGDARVDLRGCSDAQVRRLRLLGERTPTPHGEVQLCVRFTDELQRRESLLNHCLHAHLVTDAHETPAFAASRRLVAAIRDRSLRKIAPTDVRAAIVGAPTLAALAVRRATGRVRPTAAVLIDQMEQEPDPESRVTIEPRRVDRFGLPQLQLRWRIGESTRRSQERMHLMVREILARQGITSFQSSVLDGTGDTGLWDMKHPSGTTRMSSSSRAGVVDRDLRVHGVSNLFVTGSSVFPTVGHFNPTLTIVALALRLADQIGRA